jgi:hypothetical protein
VFSCLFGVLHPSLNPPRPMKSGSIQSRLCHAHPLRRCLRLLPLPPRLKGGIDFRFGEPAEGGVGERVEEALFLPSRQKESKPRALRASMLASFFFSLLADAVKSWLFFFLLF